MPSAVTVKSIVPDVVVSGFITRIDTVPRFAICAAGICAVSCVFETTFVVSATPFHRIWVPLMKFVPFTVSVKLALPAATVEGVMELIVGVTTPLNPPHPTSNEKRTSKPDRKDDPIDFHFVNRPFRKNFWLLR